jgi:ABC-2 type transport system ATP-binding protein
VTAVLEAKRLGKHYGRKWALSECSLAIPAGKVVGLVGPNGAGKSTLLQLSVGLLQPSAGSITVFNEQPGTAPSQLARVGFVAQDTPTYSGLSIADHLRFGRWMNTTFHTVVTYQPASRFWPFQWAEMGIFLVTALALCGLTYW